MVYAPGEGGVNLRKYAEQKPCLIRVPQVCSFVPEQTVLCHVRMSGISGMNLKVPDLLAAFGCAPCHAYVDANHDDSELRLLQGVMRTQAYLIERNIVKW
jgi:hypothetical protein